MNRRDFVLAALAASVSPGLLRAQQKASPVPPLPAPEPWTLGLNPATPLPATQPAEAVAKGDLAFFTPAQMGTLTHLCDVLLPAEGGKPGALAAETPMFLDFFVADSPAARKQLYTGGLAWLDSEAQRRYSKAFAEISAADADPLLRPWLRTWMSDHPPTGEHADFVNIAHHDIRTATIASRAWSDAADAGAQEQTPVDLYWSPIQPDLHRNPAPECRQPAATPPGPTPPPH